MANLEQLEDGLGPIKIGLRKDLVVSRQRLRGSVQYVLHDPVTFGNHMFSLEDYQILMALIPGRSLKETFEHLVLVEALEEDDRLPYYNFILKLHGTNLLQLPITNAKILYERHQEKQAAKKQSPLRMALYHKVPLVDPDDFLNRTLWFFGGLFTRAGLVFWLALMGIALMKCWGHFGEMVGETGTLLELSNVPVLFVALVTLKIIHEFGHAYACKKFGGEVPEMGMIFIFGAPCAYVDASASWKFGSRWQRIIVALGGMFVESIVAAIFSLIWISTQPGFLHDVAVNVLVLASMVTILFNINPLMRFDGYFIFGDLVGLPNLASRATQFIRTRLKWLLLGLEIPGQDLDRRERFLYWVYGILSSLYKISLAFSIYMMLITKWPMGGVILGVAFGYALLLKPVLGTIRYLITHEETLEVRRRAQAVAWSSITVVPALLYFLPISMQVSTPGVLEPENRVILRAPTDGFLSEALVREGQPIDTGQRLFTLENLTIEHERNLLIAMLQTKRSEIESIELLDPVEANIRHAELETLEANLRKLERDLQLMVISSPSRGHIAIRMQNAGSYVHQGDELAEFHAGKTMVRTLLTDEQVARAQINIGSQVTLRWAIAPSTDITAIVREILPMATRRELPSALTVLGGGDVYGQKQDEGELRADQAYVQVLLEPESIPMLFTAGLTARICIPAEVETIGSWLMRRLRGFYQVWRMS